MTSDSDPSTPNSPEAPEPPAPLPPVVPSDGVPDVLTDADYQAIARTRSKLAILPLALSLLAAGAAWAYQGGAAVAPAPPQAAQANKPIVDGEVHLRVPLHVAGAGLGSVGDGVGIQAGHGPSLLP